MKNGWLPAACVVILLSLLVRFDRLPEMQTQHDWLTSHTVLVTRIWQMTGLPAAHFSPISTWPNDADRFLANEGGTEVVDSRGHSYFLSFPPLAFYVSYFFFQVLGEGASPFPLRLLMVLLAAAASLPLARLFAREPEPAAWAACTAGALLLSPVSLLNYGRSLFPLILSVPLWVVTTVVFARLRNMPGNERAPWLRIAAFGALCFALCYTDWLGFLACGTYAVLAARRPRLSVVALGAAAAALMLTLAQYASIAGASAFAAHLQNRFLTRAGLMTAAGDPATISSFGTYKRVIFNYWVGLWPLLAAGALLAMLLVVRRRRPQLSPLVLTMLAALAVPVLLDNVLLINHTANHRYAILKAAPLAGVVLGVLFTANLAGTVGLPRLALWALLGFTALGCRWEFRHFRTEPEVAALANYLQYKVGLGRVLFLESSPLMSYVDPAALALAERNVKVVANRDEARRFLATRPGMSGHYIWFANGTPESITGEIVPAASQ